MWLEHISLPNRSLGRVGGYVSVLGGEGCVLDALWQEWKLL